VSNAQIIDQATELVLRIEDGLRSVHGFEPLPNAVDPLCLELVDLYLSTDDATRVAIRSVGTPAQMRVLYAFGERMAVAAVRANDISLVRKGIIAHTIEDFRWDPRENLLTLTLLWHSARKLGGDARALFLEAASLASEEAATHLRRFADAPASLKTMEAAEGENEYGFIYVRSR
jgi:hypothetical protein